MIYRALGRTGIEVSLVGLGTVKLGRNAGLRLPAFAVPDDRSARRLLAAAHALGVNLLDTAPAYGTIEARLAALLPSPREDWIICTKVGETFANGRSTHDFSAAAVHGSVAESIRRLGYLDLVLVHADGADPAALEALDVLAELRAQGRIRAIGYSHKNAAEGRAALPRSDVLMATLSPANRTEVDLIAAAGQLGTGVLVKKALDSGRAAPADALALAVNQSGVSSVVIGTASAAHLEEDVRLALAAVRPT